MRISYNKLWKMLIDKNINKRDLAERSGVSSASIAKLSKGANITTDVLFKICDMRVVKLYPGRHHGNSERLTGSERRCPCGNI